MNERIVIIGGGAAGMTAARAVAAAGGDVVLVTARLGGGSSPWAQGGIAAALGPDDTPALHLADTIACGGDLVDDAAARVLVEEAAPRVLELAAIGAPFGRDATGAFTLGLEGGHQRRRIVHAGGGATGWHVVDTLAKAVRDDPRITVIDGVTAESLITGPFGVTGVRLNRWGNASAPETVTGRVVLATGGCAGLYGRSTNPASVDGSGMALAWQAGAVLADLEFVQFHPTALDRPAPQLGGRALLLTEALRGEGAWLLDSRGRRFLAEGPLAHPLAELAPRDIVARAIVRAREDGPVYLSMRHEDPTTVRAHFGNLVALLAPLGLDLATDLLPVAPAAHYVMGGVWSDLNGATTVPGLYVAGEVACTGVQGANRLASNSMLECLVFGRRAGLAAWAGLPPRDLPNPWLTDPLETDLPAPPDDSPVPGDLGGVLDRWLGVERVESEILDALRVIPETGSGIVARRIAIGAALRTESRGAHFRRDYPTLDARWRGRILQRRGAAPVFLPLDDAAVTCTTRSLSVTR